MDGGFTALQSIEQAQQDGVKVYGPPPVPKKAATAYTRRRGDSEAIAAWRRRMSTVQGQRIYRTRCSTSETVNADLKTHRGLRTLHVRGLGKVRCIALWSALAYNLIHFAPVLIT